MLAEVTARDGRGTITEPAAPTDWLLLGSALAKDDTVATEDWLERCVMTTAKTASAKRKSVAREIRIEGFIIVR